MTDARDPRHPDASSVMDESLADDARRRLRDEGIVPIEPDAPAAVMLAPGEQVISIRRNVSVERRKDVRDPERALRGDLYVTTRRLLCLGTVPVDLPLAEIREAVIANGALRLVVGSGRGVEIRTGDPHLLRVEVAAVRMAATGSTPDRPASAERIGPADT